MHHETIPISRLIYRIIDLTTVAAHRYAFLWHLPFFCAFSCCQCILCSALICDSQTAKLFFCQLEQKNHLLYLKKCLYFSSAFFRELLSMFPSRSFSSLKTAKMDEFQVCNSELLDRRFISEFGVSTPIYGAYMNHIIFDSANL